MKFNELKIGDAVRAKHGYTTILGYIYGFKDGQVNISKDKEPKVGSICFSVKESDVIALIKEVVSTSEVPIERPVEPFTFGMKVTSYEVQNNINYDHPMRFDSPPYVTGSNTSIEAKDEGGGYIFMKLPFALGFNCQKSFKVTIEEVP